MCTYNINGFLSQQQYTQRPQDSANFKFHLLAQITHHLTSSTFTCRWGPMRCNLYTLSNWFAGKKRLPAIKLATESVLSKLCTPFTDRLDRVSLQHSFLLKNSWEQRYTEQQNSRRGPPENRTKIQVFVDRAKIK